MKDFDGFWLGVFSWRCGFIRFLGAGFGFSRQPKFEFALANSKLFNKARV